MLSCRAGDSSRHACILRVEVELDGASLGARDGPSRTAPGSGPLLLRNSPWGSLDTFIGAERLGLETGGLLSVACFSG